MAPQLAPYPCPECGGTLSVQEAETESPVFRQAPRTVGHVEMVRRPCVAALCSSCEFVVELQGVKVGGYN